jgi:cell volume regulation protein A
VVLAAAVLLAAGVLTSRVTERLRIPSLVLFLAIGMLVADDGLAWIRFSDSRLAANLSIAALLFILFDGGLSTNRHEVRSVLAPSGVLATVGVLITAAVVALALMFMFDAEPETAWLIGAVVASTDAAAVFAALRRLPLPQRVANAVKVESGLNDPMAILLTIGFIEAQRHSVTMSGWAVFGLRQLGLGLLIGTAVGLIGAILIERVELPSLALYPVLATAIGGIAYGSAALAGSSGFLAVYVTGLVLADRAPRHRRGLRTFHEGLAAGAEVGLFFLLGVLVFPSRLADVALDAFVAAMVLALVARPLAVLISLVWFRWTARELVFVSWAGLRGAVPIVLATFPLTAHHPHGQLIFDVVFFVVLISATVQGATLSWLGRRLGLERGPDLPRSLIELTPTDSLATDIIEVDISRTSTVLGQPLRAIPPPDGARVALISRAGRTFVPTGSTTLQGDDHLVISAERGQINTDRVARWLGDDPTEETHGR